MTDNEEEKAPEPEDVYNGLINLSMNYPEIEEDLIEVIVDFPDEDDKTPSHRHQMLEWLNKVKQTLSASSIRKGLDEVGREIVDRILKAVNSLIKFFTKAKSQQPEIIDPQQDNKQPLKSIKCELMMHRAMLKYTAEYRQRDEIKKRADNLSKRGLDDVKNAQKQVEKMRESGEGGLEKEPKIYSAIKTVQWIDQEKAAKKIQGAFRKQKITKAAPKNSKDKDFSRGK